MVPGFSRPLDRLRQRSRQSLTVWLGWRALAVALGVALLVGSVAAGLAGMSERGRLTDRLGQTLAVTSLAARPVLEGKDHAAAERLARSLVESGATDRVELRAADGTRLASLRHDGEEPGLVGLLLGGAIQAVQPIQDEAGNTVGTLALGMSAAGVARLGSAAVLPLLLAGLPCALLLGALLTLQVHARIVRPLREFGEALRGGRGADPAALSLPIPPNHEENELGRVVRSVSETLGDLGTAQADLYRMARRDPLTGLPNRMSMTDSLARAVTAARNHDGQLALLYLDLDRFKHVNDSLGHAAGDKLLLAVAQRLRELVGSPEGLARMGGDEFMLLLERVTDRSKVIRLAGEIVDSLSRSYSINGQPVHVSVSIGISLWPRDGTDGEQLIRSADTAMYAAKAAGAGTWRFYSREMLERSLVFLRTEASLREALEQEQLEVFYQPKLRSANGRLYGMEALLRWRRHDRYVNPAEFIPIAEDTGLIIPVGAWVLRTACAQAMRWSRLHGPLQMAVNVSARQLALPEFAETVRAALEESGLPGEQLTLEITESMLMDNIDSAIEALRNLRSLGCGISVDDFGTGYSSLSYLRQLPITQLKIDRTFIKDLPVDTAIAETVLTLAAKLNLQCVAEGVETDAQYQWLVRAGCHLLQGFFIAKPLPVREFEQQFLPGPGLRLVSARDGLGS